MANLSDILKKWQDSDADQYGQRVNAGLCCKLVQDANGKWDYCPEPATIVKQMTFQGVTTEHAYCDKHQPA